MVLVPVNPDDVVVQELRAAGLRVTMPRQAVLTWLGRHPHSTADAIAAGVREKFGALSLQAIYGVVRVSTEAGQLRRIEPAGHPARYERRVGDNHHHPVCRRCAQTTDVDCVAGKRTCLELADGHGFAIDEAEVVFWGLCPVCVAAAGSRAETLYHEEEWQ
jgi:Fe2+ or Zn2+ uptake regulation protein